MNVAPLPGLPQVRDHISDPYALLGVTAEATHDQVRQAYIQLAKSYHPDCYATTSLPGEVCEYLSAMARHINAAYEDVQAARQKP